MNNIEQYIDYMSDSLSPEAEQKFAENFAGDSEFRDSFKNYLLISSTVRKNAEQFAPSPELKDAVFNKLGFNSNKRKPVFIPAISTFKSFLTGKIFAVLMSSIITLLVVFSLLNQSEQESSVGTEGSTISNNKNGSTAPKVVMGTNGKSFPTKPVSERRQISASKKVSSFANVDIPVADAAVSSNDIHSGNASHQTTDISTENSTDNSKDILLSDIFVDSDIVPSGMESANNSEILQVQWLPNDTMLPTIAQKESKYRFEFKNTPSWFETVPNINPQTPNQFNNLSAAAYFPASPIFLLGAEFRQETFSLRYEGRNSAGLLADYQQHPNLSTFSANLRFLPFRLSERILPYGQIAIGGNYSGFVFREMFGLEYHPYSNIYLILGAEFNQFAFEHQKKWFNASKYSLNYGLGVRF